eukprot:791441-Pelagomonas_calceolata.AAC.6
MDSLSSHAHHWLAGSTCADERMSAAPKGQMPTNVSTPHFGALAWTTCPQLLPHMRRSITNLT